FSKLFTIVSTQSESATTSGPDQLKQISRRPLVFPAMSNPYTSRPASVTVVLMGEKLSTPVLPSFGNHCQFITVTLVPDGSVVLNTKRSWLSLATRQDVPLLNTITGD